MPSAYSRLRSDSVKRPEASLKSPTIDSREATPAQEPQSDDKQPGAIDCLDVLFLEPLKDPRNGVQCGTNSRSSDILLGTEGCEQLARSSTRSPWTTIFVYGYRTFIRRMEPQLGTIAKTERGVELGDRSWHMPLALGINSEISDPFRWPCHKIKFPNPRTSRLSIRREFASVRQEVQGSSREEQGRSSRCRWT